MCKKFCYSPDQESEHKMGDFYQAAVPGDLSLVKNTAVKGA